LAPTQKGVGAILEIMKGLADKLWGTDRLGLARLNHAVSYLLARDVNVLSATSPGLAGNETLRDALFHLLTELRPNVFCDVGANDGATSLAVRAAIPSCEVHAYEANPEIHARYAAKLAEHGVTYRNLAVSDANGQARVYAPRTLSRAYVDGQVVSASIVEERDNGKTSLLRRDEEATYDNFDVETRTLDGLFENRTGPSGASFFLWVDVEGAAERVLAGATGVLRRTLALFVECENFPFWHNGSSAGGVASLLFRAGFVPVARDREYGDKQFNVLFVAGRVAHLLAPDLFDARSPVRACLLPGSVATPAPASQPERPVFSSVASYLQAEVPVFVPCFNNSTYTARMVSQLRKLGFRRVVLVDGGSTYPPMRDLLAAPGEGVSVVTLLDNQGPHHLFLDAATLALMPRHFCITDPDLVFNPAMPADFLGDLAALTARERVGKAGLALDLSNPDAMRDEPFFIGDRSWRIWEWEEQFWRDELEPLRPGGDPVYRADVDTTFALYDRNFFNPERQTEAVRLAGRFTCRHLPWYRDKELPQDEENFYRSTERYSYFFRASKPESGELPGAAQAPATPDVDNSEILQLRTHLAAIYASSSWRYTRPLRTFGRILGRPPAVELAPAQMALPELRQQIEGIRLSTSWRLTGPLRVISRRVRGGRR
jgi:FkbM family methyltransferase